MLDDLSLKDFLHQFQTEDACIEFLYQLKWPSGFLCPRCSHHEAYIIDTRRLPLFQCMSCHHQTSLIVNTVMQGSRTSLHKWFIALFLASRISEGISALQLSKKINVTYKTAWLMLHKIRDAMSEADASVKLCGFVEVNDVYYGHKPHSSPHRQPHEYPLLMGATMQDSETPTYLKINRVPDDCLNDRRILKAGKDQFIQQCVEPDTRVNVVVGSCVSAKYKRLYPLFRQLNHWIKSTFHSIGRRHFDAYLNEFCYRFNIYQQGKNIFEHLAHLCAISKPISYAFLVL